MGSNRRNVLKLAGASLATGVAGCLGSNEENGNGTGGGDEPPAYTRWLAADDDGGVGYVYVDLTTFENADTGNESTGGESNTDVQADPMVGLPMAGTVAAAIVVSFGLSAYGLEGMVDYGQSEEQAGGTESMDSSVDAMISTNEAVVLTGDIDTAEVDETLTTEPEGFSFTEQYERTDEIGDYPVYTPVDGEGNGSIAVGDSALVFTAGGDTDDPTGAIRTPIEAAAGDVERATDELEAFDWLVSQAGHGDFVVGGYGNEFEPDATETAGDGGGNFSDIENGSQDGFDAEYSELEGLEGGVGSLTLDEDGTQATGEFAAILGDADADALEESLGSSAAESTVEVADGRVTASATWESLD
ncbi:hypothetical protein [Natrinema salaciae]|uniref:Uncharacterized protein n=1 Tax=Natrinema salaciae TaxID=1186196 RepID=A0A1H8ZLH7_9EURY|nr:hypothetical protein [Natrinema salaciae]SEP65137.1 hypothetical protein SAMN04489841_0202 [Natrinema salaciae]